MITAHLILLPFHYYHQPFSLSCFCQLYYPGRKKNSDISSLEINTNGNVSLC